MMWTPIITCLAWFCAFTHPIVGQPLPTEAECRQAAEAAIRLAGADSKLGEYFKVECREVKP